MRLNQIARQLNIATKSIVAYLSKEGVEVIDKPNTKLLGEQVDLIMKKFGSSRGLFKGKRKILPTAALVKPNAPQKLVIDKGDIKNKLTPEEEMTREKEIQKSLVKEKKKMVVEEQMKDAKKKLGGDGKEDEKKVKTGGKEQESEKKVKTGGKEQESEKKVKTGGKEQGSEKKVKTGGKEREDGKKVKIGEKEQKSEKKLKVGEQLKEVKKELQPEGKVKEERKVVGVAKGAKKEMQIAEKKFIKKVNQVGKNFSQAPKKDVKEEGGKSGKGHTASSSANSQSKSSDLPPKPQIKVLGEISIPKRQGGKKVREKRPRARIKPQFNPASFKRLTTTPVRGERYVKKKQGPNKVKRREYRERKQEKHATRRRAMAAQSVVKVTEFISAHELAPLLHVSVMDILDICMNLGMKVSLNQRLNKEAINIIAEELGQELQFVSIEEEMAGQEKPDDEKDLIPSAPVVTVMGHVDHGKTSLLDYMRKTKVTQEEAGGITQHIGAYDVNVSDGRRVVFLDTPGHKAFTAMRARGAKITDVAIIIIAANDGVKPQTKEAISHAQIAGLPIVIAINKIDHPQADANRVKQELAGINIMVEDWGGKYQCQEISAKTGEGIDELLEKVLLEADILAIKVNPNKKAQGSVIEASLKKGQGYMATILVQQGTLKKGDILAAGSYYGKVKAMFNSHGKQVKEAAPATPVQVLGLDGAPDAGQACRVMESDREARALANRYKSILQEQKLRSQNQVAKKRKANLFDENQAQVVPILIKGDVSGSVEALADALLLLSNDDVHIHILYKAVGPVSESDVLLASTSEALIIGFHTGVTPQAATAQAREKVTIKSYKIIYEAIEDMKLHIKSLAEPEVKEKVVIGTAEVRKTFYISRIGTIAGCYVKEGVIKRNADIKLLRDGNVLYEGAMKQLKREKEVIKEARADSECGISIDGFNDIQEGDIIQAIE